jgi:hypothetical protein
VLRPNHVIIGPTSEPEEEEENDDSNEIKLLHV